MTKTINFSQVQGKKGQNPFKDSINELKMNLDTQFEFYQLQAKCKKEYFDNLIKEGFTEYQALEIVKSSNF